MASIFRPSPGYIDGKKVAEMSDSSEDRNVNAANQYGIDGVIGQSIGADELKFSFGVVVPVQGTEINMDEIIGVPISIGSLRNGKMVMCDGVITSSGYTSDSKTGECKGKFEFIGGQPRFV